MSQTWPVTSCLFLSVKCYWTSRDSEAVIVLEITICPHCLLHTPMTHSHCGLCTVLYRLRWLRNKTAHQLKVQHFYQQLLRCVLSHVCPVSPPYSLAPRPPRLLLGSHLPDVSTVMQHGHLWTSRLLWLSISPGQRRACFGNWC